MDIEEMRAVVAQCEFVEAVPYSFHVTESSGRIYLQATYVDRDIVSGEPETQYTRKWLLSPYMLKSEIVRTVFALCAASMEHRLRESFKYRGRRIFGPHFDVDALWEIARKVEVRSD